MKNKTEKPIKQVPPEQGQKQYWPGDAALKPGTKDNGKEKTKIPLVR